MMAPWRSLCLAVIFLAVSSCFSQSREPDDSWLMQNYRFTGPPAPCEIRPVSPVLAHLQEVQNTILSILRKADFAGDGGACFSLPKIGGVSAALFLTSETGKTRCGGLRQLTRRQTTRML